jgi:predicted subunit of tRNA(5-methylaminomethyl-2-thiouridylate) methyltransferase
LPQQANAARNRSFDHDVVQMRPPNSLRPSMLKFSLNHGAAIEETNTAKRIGVAFGDFDAKVAQGFNAIRQKALAARFVDGRNRAIRHDHTQALTACRDRGCEASRSTSRDEHIPRLGKLERHKSLNTTIEMRYL